MASQRPSSVKKEVNGHNPEGDDEDFDFSLAAESKDDSDEENNSDNESFPEKPPAIARRRSSSRQRKQTRRLGYCEETEEEKEEDEEKSHETERDIKKEENDSGEESKDVEPKPKRRKGATPTRSKKNTAKTKEKEELVCPHCNKTLKNKKGLEYHIKNFVCRPAERPGGPVQRGKRKEPPQRDSDEDDDEDDGGDGTSPVKKKRKKKQVYKKIRGKKEKRTCGKCGRVFTSVLGLNYHVEKKVCEKAEAMEKPFSALQPGTMALHAIFGVVKVVRDDRAEPTAEFSSKMKQLLRQYQASKQKQQAQIEKTRISRQSIHLLQRKRLSKLYQRGHITGQTVSSVYYRKDPFQTEKSDSPRPFTLKPDEKADPNAPEGSFPERIVECVLVQDSRARYVGMDREECPQATVSEDPKSLTKLFVRRDSLKPVNNDENGEVLLCPVCGQPFTSRAGLQHHMRFKSCEQRAEEAFEKRERRMNEIEGRASTYLIKGTPQPKRKPLDPSLGETGKTEAVAASSAVDAVEGDADHPPPVLTKEESKKTPQADPKFVDPRITLQSMTAEFRVYQSQMLGTMYPSVFKALGYKKAGIPKKKKKKKKKVKKKVPVVVKRVIKVKKKKDPAAKRARLKAPPASQRSAEQEENDRKPAARATRNSAKGGLNAANATSSKEVDSPQGEARFANLPQLIDTRVLVAEVKTGRYPSMNQHKGPVAHTDKCAVCRKDPTEKHPLVPCGFCTSAIHFHCLCEKFTVKEPEPDDAFMCHHCIQYITARRARAEKRRLEKLGVVDPLPISQLKGEIVPEAKRLVEGKEYECVLAQGTQLADLVELLRDAKTRLEQVVHTSKANEVRRATMMGL